MILIIFIKYSLIEQALDYVIISEKKYTKNMKNFKNYFESLSSFSLEDIVAIYRLEKYLDISLGASYQNSNELIMKIKIVYYIFVQNSPRFD